ncbi:MAG: MltA domain-containing protein [Burkholderiales bacterium]
MNHIVRTLLAAAIAIVLVASCVPLPPAPPSAARYVQTSYADLPGWPAAELGPSLRAFLAGCPRLQAVPALARACDAASAVPPDNAAAARSFLEATFVPYAVIAPEGSATGLVTGYYEPVLDGSRGRTDRFRYPIYGVPDDLVDVDLASLYPELKGLRLRGRLDGRRLVPYYSRAEIDAHGDGFAAPVIAWVADPVELFFLQIQGSGQIRLGDDDRIRVSYADQNGHPYSSLGRYLVAQGELPLEQASMDGIKQWAQAHPEQLRHALEQNPSYVFFRELPASGGPIGALGAPLSAGYSIAVDRRFYPLGAPVYLATTLPPSDQPLERLVMAQDTGGAIRGAVRADLFCGSGTEAGSLAGGMRQQGRMWVLWPRGETLPRP